MATVSEEHEKDFEKREKELKHYLPKPLGELIDKVKEHFKSVLELEGKLSEAAEKAREDGVKGSSLSDFKKNDKFYSIYKLMAAKVDDLSEALREAWADTNQARAGNGNLNILRERVEKDLGKLKDQLEKAQKNLKDEESKAKSGKGTVSTEVKKLAETLEKDFKKQGPSLKETLSRIDALKKELAEAGDLYRKKVPSRAEDYPFKFKKMVEKLVSSIAGVEEDDKTVELPKELRASVFGMNIKKAAMLRKSIEKHLKVAETKMAKRPEFAKPDFKAAKTEFGKLETARTYFTGLKNDKNVKAIFEKGDNPDDIKKQLEQIEKQLKAEAKSFEDLSKSYKEFEALLTAKLNPK